MKKTILSLFLSVLFLTASFSAQANKMSDLPGLIKKSHALLMKNAKYQAVKSNSKVDEKTFNNIEKTLLGIGYFDAKSRLAYFKHITTCSVKSGLFLGPEAKLLNQILVAASMQKGKVAGQLVEQFAKSATSEAGKKLGVQLTNLMKEVKAQKDGRQSIDGFFGKLGRLIGTVAGAIVGGISGGIVGALGGAIAGGKLGGLIGDAIDNMGTEVWAGPNGDEQCTPPFFG